MKQTILFLLCVFFIACSSNKEEVSEEQEEVVTLQKKKRFTGDYNKTFNDLQAVHYEAAVKNGIKPMKTKGDTLKMKDNLIRLPDELVYYTTDRLTHSVPFLVPSASNLFLRICANFQDSLISKQIPLHKLILTSVTRTEEDVKKLTKSNVNASESSTHCYGTTFDISWRRFAKKNPFDEDVSTEKLKYVLGQVLHDLQCEEMCYIKHERKQACFHITVR